MIDPWAPLGAALRAYHTGDLEARLTVESDLYETEETPVAEYYRPSSVSLPDLENTALAGCRGHVLDLGAGAGRHALELQQRGLHVTAVEINSTAAWVMRARGVRRPVVGDLWTLRSRPFDTVLMLMNGLGAVGDIAGLHRWLGRLDSLVAPDGVVICDSTDLLHAFSPTEMAELGGRRRARAALGETSFRLTFRECRGSWYRWLFCPEESLRRAAEGTGWSLEVTERGPRGSYLVHLRPPVR